MNKFFLVVIEVVWRTNFMQNKRAMLRSLGGGKIKKKSAMLGSLGLKKVLTKLDKMQLLTKFQNNLMDHYKVVLNPS